MEGYRAYDLINQINECIGDKIARDNVVIEFQFTFFVSLFITYLHFNILIMEF